jgi:hypothetical protein
MPRPSSGIRSLLRQGLIFLALLIYPAAALAVPVHQVSGWYEKPDTFSITNESISGEAIVELLLDLSGSAGAIFDRRGLGFQVTSSDAVGFDTALGFDLLAQDVLRLVFSDFGAGETFSFAVNVNATGTRFAGASLSATLASGEPLTASYLVDPLNDKRATVMLVNPEPSTVLLLAAGLAALAIRRRGRHPHQPQPRS